jgi:predicted nucleotidyltransferase
MVLNLDLVRQRRTDIERVANQFGARNVRVFGSVARGEAGPRSDLDLLVKFEPGRSLLDLIAIQQDLTEMLGCKVDVVSEGALKPGDRILQEAVTL